MRFRRRAAAVNGAPTPARRLEGPRPLLSVIVPTKNEAGNVARLLARLECALPTVAMEIVFVDASTDGTADVIESIGRRSERDVLLVRQVAGGRMSGLGAAVVQGLAVARAPWVCVMDADLQHPPELIPELLERAESGDLDLVVASRYCDRGDAESFGWARAMASRSTTNAARLLFPTRLRQVTDPMSGFFLVRREAVELDLLRPRGFKILLEILVRNPGLRAAEVSFRFGRRAAGRSKATIAEAVRYLSLLARLRFARFGAVGASGLIVNTLVLTALTDVLGIFYVLSAVLATQASTLWNFLLTESWVFSDREHKRGWPTRMGLFFLMNNAALVLRGPLLVFLTSGLGVHYVISNLLSLLLLTLVRFAVADSWIWAKASPAQATPSPYAYDVHGIVTVLCDVRLPELERFRAGDLAGRPDLRIRVGRHTKPAGPASVEYRERGGPLGFGVSICRGATTEVSASQLLGWSPHVLYTNVVEPILRWTFVERGYALVHAACVSDGEAAYLVTARTDTGKTTTCLRLLDGGGFAFLSDDLTLVTPDGRALTYPKPLTISRHTLHAVRTPLLARRERLALILQSRLHSRSGRRLALILARTHLPAATINALIQLLVPPPKYHVERLVPEAAVVPEARLAGMVVIERGGVGELALTEREALATLMSNCEDAYGFPPYPAIEGFLSSRGQRDLKPVERGIVAGALHALPSAVLRSETMDWWSRLPDLIGRWPAPALSNGDSQRTADTLGSERVDARGEAAIG
jgi:dolichol-phosphate mannosyltransferase